MHSESRAPSPFHAGEKAVQQRLGVRDVIEPWARRVVRPHLPDEHRAFFSALPFVVAAARDVTGRPWATLVAGAPGFIASPDPKRLELRAALAAGDALEGALVAGSDVGLLGIELDSRRRNRANGRVASAGDEGISLSIEQAFGNCPQYISERVWRPAPRTTRSATATRHARLTGHHTEWIGGADTFFIATGHREDDADWSFGMDASHRGGPRGFVHVEDDRTLMIPDYAGNNHFNTIGNLVLDARAGLVFVDFRSGGLLQLTGHIEIDWTSEAIAHFPAARRLLRFTLDEAVELTHALPIRWDEPTEATHPFRLVKRIRESDDVTSFLFARSDRGPLPAFEAGQHLPIELDVPGHEQPISRTYSLSNDPADEHYRISVKREPWGLASGHLHGALEVGDVVAARAPAGDFVLDHATRAVVLVSAGIGVTPMVSMLHALASQPRRPVIFVHGARDGHHHPFSDEVRRAVAARPNGVLHVRYSQPQATDRAGVDHHDVGRIDGALLERLLPGLDGEFHLCGPVAFMSQVGSDLETRGVAPERIHTESFGPVA